MTMKREVADHQRDRVDCMHCAGSALYTHTMCTHTPHISAFDSAPIPLLSLLLVFVEREREMGTLPPRSVAVDDARVEDAKVGQEEADRDRQQKQLDAGALFVLKSKGSWVHCGYHLTTSIVAPPLLSLPYAFTFLGCMAGILCLVIEALVTFYSYNLISLVFENYAQLGRRHLRLRDMALDILGAIICGVPSSIGCVALRRRSIDLESRHTIPTSRHFASASSNHFGDLESRHTIPTSRHFASASSSHFAFALNKWLSSPSGVGQHVPILVFGEYWDRGMSLLPVRHLAFGFAFSFQFIEPLSSVVITTKNFHFVNYIIECLSIVSLCNFGAIL
ncbi:uncharacterized protein [Malus domestica]|uniref:uncharacterized protein isoform X2 n=1 Tax=Malus domestica TaxID=3750 RepID=UPI003975FE8D